MRVGNLILFVVGASACCSTWLRTAQTAKNLGFIEYGSVGTPIVLNLVYAPSATSVQDIQVDYTIHLNRGTDDLPTTATNCECPLPDCFACRQYFDTFLVINNGQGVDVPVLLNPDENPIQVFPISLPRNDSNLLYGQVGSLHCVDQEFQVQYNTKTDPNFDIRWPEGIELNEGDLIQLWITSIAQSQDCFPSDGVVGLGITGIANYVLSYGECTGLCEQRMDKKFN